MRYQSVTSTASRTFCGSAELEVNVSEEVQPLKKKLHTRPDLNSSHSVLTFRSRRCASILE